MGTPRRDGGYRWILRLFPRRFREEHGEELIRLHEEMRRDWVSRGRTMAGFRLALLWDGLKGATAAWVSALVRGPAITRERGSAVGTVMQDIRFGLRQLVRQPLFSATIVLLVAVGIAGNAAVFRVFNGMFLRPLPFPEADRLVDIDVRAPAWDLEYVSVSIADYRAWSEGSRTLDELAAYFVGGGNLVTEDGARRVDYLVATHTLDDVLRIEPDLGRFFDESEDQPDQPLVAVLSAAFWEQDFAADPAVLGRTLRLNGSEVEVIGVLPRSADFLGDADLWLPLQEDDQSSFYLTGIGRLRADVTPIQAEADLRAIHEALIEERPVNEATDPVVASLRDRYLGDTRLSSTVLFAAVAVVLLIACANIAALMFARAVARSREVAVRRALGATRTRLVRQLLTESVLLAGAGGLLGCLAGIWASRLLLDGFGDQLPPWVTFDLDPVFLAFAVAVTGGAAVVFGLVPALRATTRDSGQLRRGTPSARTRRGLRFLVAGQVALSGALLVAAGLLASDMRGLGEVDPGFDPDGLLTYRIQLTGPAYEESEARQNFMEAYRTRLAELPGAEGVVLASNLPLMGHSGWFFEAEATLAESDADDGSPVVLRRWATPGYFEKLGVVIAQGRAFDDFDGREEGSEVIVVNESFVRTHLPPDVDPVGQRVRLRGGDDEWLTIVGVTRDVKHYGVDQEMRPGTYEPLRQNAVSFLQVAIRGEGSDLLAGARAVTAELDPGLALFDVQTMDDRMQASLLTRRATAWMVSVFSAVALLLSGAGLYGAISYGVGRRRREIGIRMAMGAQAGQVGRSVVVDGMVIAGLGIVVGLGVAAVAGDLMAGILVDTGTLDPGVYATVAALLVAVAAVANWIPARRAARMSPMTTLRSEE